MITIVPRYAMDSYHQTKFEESVLWLKSANKDFVKPLTFLLGFYVSLVVKRSHLITTTQVFSHLVSSSHSFPCLLLPPTSSFSCTLQLPLAPSPARSSSY